MEIFDPFFYRSRKCRIPIQSSEKTTAYNKNHKAQHSTTYDGMEIVQYILFLALNESIRHHVPKNEEVGEKEHA